MVGQGWPLGLDIPLTTNVVEVRVIDILGFRGLRVSGELVVATGSEERFQTLCEFGFEVLVLLHLPHVVDGLDEGGAELGWGFGQGG